MTKVFAFPKYGREAASTRQRLLQFLPALKQAGFDCTFSPFLGDDYVRAFATGNTYPRWSAIRSYLHRFRKLGDARDSDLIWVYGELFPYLPGRFEALAPRIGKPVLYDFDDAFFHEHEKHALLRDKLRPLISGAAAVTARQ